jgi:hypothetical protein
MLNIKYTSDKGKLDLNDLKGLLRNSAIVAGLAGLTHFVSNAGSLNFGAGYEFLAVVAFFIGDSILKLFRKNVEEEKKEEADGK